MQLKQNIFQIMYLKKGKYNRNEKHFNKNPEKIYLFIAKKCLMYFNVKLFCEPCSVSVLFVISMLCQVTNSRQRCSCSQTFSVSLTTNTSGPQSRLWEPLYYYYESTVLLLDSTLQISLYKNS